MCPHLEEGPEIDGRDEGDDWGNSDRDVMGKRTQVLNVKDVGFGKHAENDKRDA